MKNRSNFYRNLQTIKRQKFYKKVSFNSVKSNLPYCADYNTINPILKDDEERFCSDKFNEIIKTRKIMDILSIPNFNIRYGIPAIVSHHDEFFLFEEKKEIPLIIIFESKEDLILQRRIYHQSLLNLDSHNKIIFKGHESSNRISVLRINYEDILNLINNLNYE